jgi:hypothetical protein
MKMKNHGSEYSDQHQQLFKPHWPWACVTSVDRLGDSPTCAMCVANQESRRATVITAAGDKYQQLEQCVHSGAMF